MAISKTPTPREQRALKLARDRLRSLSPSKIANHAAVRHRPQGEGKSILEVPFLNRLFRVSYPEGLVEAVDGSTPKHALCLLILHYLFHAEGHRMADRWVAFRELPNGLMYHQAFQARAEPPLVSAYGTRLEDFSSAARTIGGSPIEFGDAAFMFDVLPRIRLAIIVHLGDDEFPPAANVLFDAAAGHYLPTEDLAILGGMLVGALFKATSR